ncbi:MAG: hypothetical protein CL528_12760 [Aequorivita sp.]|nr:hypothetical protein [Aequorivita sp.]|tara:strand:- start:470 stop:1105 length:636 start_codon:yes stop_codon:yes gene_type:complete
MTKVIDATFDPSKTWQPIEEGTYPAHIKSLSTREVQTRAGEAIVVNMKYRVADEVKDQEQDVWEMDGYKYVKDNNGNRVPVMNSNGKQSVMSCSHLKGREFQDNGFFIFTSSQSSSKNRKYFELLDNLRISCEEADVDGNKVKQLVLIEEDDVIGKPVIVTIKRQEFVTSETKHLPPEQQERRSTFKVSNMVLWNDGVALDPDELTDDVPF